MSTDDLSGIFAARDDTLMTALPPRPRRPWLGVCSIALVVVVAVVDAIAIRTAYANDYATAIALAVTAIGTATIAFGLALVAVITRRGRWWGVAALPLSVAVNPYLLAAILGMASGIAGT